MYSFYSLIQSKKYIYSKISGGIVTILIVNCYYVTEFFPDLVLRMQI